MEGIWPCDDWRRVAIIMDKERFAGYRIMGFSPVNMAALAEVAELLVPHRREILESWLMLQTDAWEPPGISRADLKQVFDGLLGSILGCTLDGNLETCIDYLQLSGNDLAARQFPFEALIISVHFLERSYMPYLLNPPTERTPVHLVAMDEFLHAVLAAISTAYFEAYRRELMDQAEVGRIVQEGLMADIPKNAADLEIAHVYISARERAQLGGDFLDYVSMDARQATFVIGDLSGHGVEAAADSVMVRSLFRGFMRENPNLTEAMARVNRVLATELESGQFATVLAVFYEMTGHMSLVSAGHPYPVVCNSDCALVQTEGIALGVDPTYDYTISEADLEPGGVFVAYTDGVCEARRGKEMFGDQRIVQAVAAKRHLSARGIAEHLIDEAHRHAGGKFADDVAVLVLKRRGG